VRDAGEHEESVRDADEDEPAGTAGEYEQSVGSDHDDEAAGEDEDESAAHDEEEDDDHLAMPFSRTESN
jgi:hypothetical protein